MRITLVSVYKNRGNEVNLYAILQARSNEADKTTNISHRSLPTYREHVKFVRSMPYRAWLFVKVDGLVAGTLNITKLNEIGIVLLPEYRGKGIGRAALKMLLSRHRPLYPVPGHRGGKFLANINPANARSIALFTSLGFKHIQNTYQL